MKTKVYFTRDITPEKVVELYKAVGAELEGRIAVKVHSGEEGNQNYITPDFWAQMVNHVDGTVVECNTAYDGERNVTDKHLKLLENHGWAQFPCDLMDAAGDDLVLDIPNGKHIKKNYVGKNLAKYDSLLVLSHFKGHPMGGFGGALKQLSIGIASGYGKEYIHGAGDPSKFWDTPQEIFIETMADAASSVVEKFAGKAVYINVMKNLSVDCDCCAVAKDPCMGDVGMLASIDPVAVDKACLDLVYASADEGKDVLIERIESRKGSIVIDAAVALGAGNVDYELIEI